MTLKRTLELKSLNKESIDTHDINTNKFQSHAELKCTNQILYILSHPQKKSNVN